MNGQEKKPTRSRDFDAEIILGPEATIGDKLRALRLSRKMTISALSQASGLSDRAIRYIENNEREPGVDVIRRLSAALGVDTDYFMEDTLFRQEIRKEDLLNQASEKYGARGKEQARQIYESVKSLYASGRLNAEERDDFRDLMIEIFFETKEDAKKYIPRKYRGSSEP